MMCSTPGCKSGMESGETCVKCSDYLCDQCLVATACRDSLDGRHEVDEETEDTGDETWNEFPDEDEGEE